MTRHNLSPAILALLCLGAALLAPTAASAGETVPNVGQHRGGTAIQIVEAGAPRGAGVPARSGSARAVAKTSTFVVTYVGVPSGAKAAIQRAIDLWSSLVTSSQPIRITVTWKPLADGALGRAGPSGFQKNFAGAPRTNTWYPSALANAYAGRDLSTDNDIDAAFASTGVPWFYGTDGAPTAGTYDLTTVALHEIGHGLGFLSSTDVTNGTGRWSDGDGVPIVYDRYVQNASGASLIGFADGSTALAAQLQSNAVVWSGPQAVAANGGAKPALYAPNPFVAGSSISHLASGSIGGDQRNSLMEPSLGAGDWIHDPGDIGLGVLRDIGWKTVGAQTKPSAPSGVIGSAGNGKVDLFWSAPVSTGRQKLTSYMVYRYTGGSTTSDQSITTFSTTASLPYPSLSNGTSYRFAVAAVNATGIGPRSSLSGPITPSIVAPFADVDGLVRAQFTDFLGRSPTAAELTTWRGRANDGTKHSADIVVGIGSLDPSATPSERLTRLYAAYFKRLPDFGGYTYWVGKVRSGTSLTKASDTFAASSEFKRTYGSLSNKAFVTLVYKNVLGRAPDSGGASYWLGRLDRMVVSRGGTMIAFSESSENIRKKESLVGSVLLRAAMLRRMPTPAELTTDVANLDGPGTLADLAEALLGSSEYQARFGVTLPGTGNFVPLAGTGYGSVVADATGHYAYISNTAQDRVDVVDIIQRRLVGGIAVGDQPMGLDLSADGTRLYVANRGSATISEIDTSARTVVRSITLPTFADLPLQPQDVAYAAGGRLVVANDSASNQLPPVLRITLATGASKQVALSTGEATLAACPDRMRVIIGEFDNVTYYDTATDAGTSSQALIHSNSVSCGGGSSTLALAAGTGVYGPTLTRVGTVLSPDGDQAGPGAVDPTRAVGYRTEQSHQATTIEVLDLDHMRVTQSIPLPEKTADIVDGQITVSGDGAVVLAITAHGLAVIEAPAVLTPPPAPVAAAIGSPLVPMAGRVTDVEIPPSGATAWATNVDLNQVEVFDLATRARLATIPVGSQPNAVTFSPDGTKAYVVGPGSALMTVIDVATRTALRRVAVAAPGYANEFPIDIGATADGRLHIATESHAGGTGSIFSVGIATEAFVAGSRIYGQVGEMDIVPSRDGSQALLVTFAEYGSSSWYSAATQALTSVQLVGGFQSIAVDGTGARAFNGVGSFDHELAETCSTAFTGTSAFRGTVTSDGLQAFRLEGASIERISMSDCSVLGTTPSGDVASTVALSWDRSRPGAIATTNDGSTVAAATPNGLSIVHPVG